MGKKNKEKLEKISLKFVNGPVKYCVDLEWDCNFVTFNSNTVLCNLEK